MNSTRGGASRCVTALTLVALALGATACSKVSEAEEAPPSPPTLSLTAAQTSVQAGATTSLTWTSTDATACTASGTWSGARPAQGTETSPTLTSTGSFTLECTGPGGSVSRTVTVSVTAVVNPPALTFSANPASIAAGGTAQLTWTGSNVTSCQASGAWSGSRATSGTQTTAALAANATFVLDCTGAGGSIQRQVTVTVTSTPPPTLTLDASPTTVSNGARSTLSWSTTGATACTASGGWSGARGVSGSESTATLTSTTTFTLDCSGAGGNVSRSVTVTVAGGGAAGLGGAVDSSLVRSTGTNRVYVFSGAVTPDDQDGAGVEPLVTIPVTQDANACTFAYRDAALPQGSYTIAFTADAALDDPTRNDSLTFVGTRSVTVGANGAVEDFAATRVLRVGATRQYANLRAVQAAVQPGDLVEVDAGTYVDDVVVWRTNRVTLRGVGGGRAHVQGTQVITFVSGDDQRNGKGLMVMRGADVRVENFEFSGARVTDLNGAGIRVEGQNLTVCNGYCHDNQDGMLAEALGTLTVEYTVFERNGAGDPGFNHNIYVTGGNRLVFRHNYSRDSNIGHTLKTRAAENFILYNRLMSEASGRTSYEIDVPDGGLTYVVGNLLQQGPNGDNSTILAYGAEGLSAGRTNELYLVNNTIVNDRGSGTFVSVNSGAAVFRSVNNLFVGNGTVYSGRAVDATTDLRGTSTDLVDSASYDYRLRATSAARDAGTAPGAARGVDLTPVYQYVHPGRRAARPTDARIDIGAYEYAP